MIKSSLLLIIFGVIFLGTAYSYYFHHDVLARFVVASGGLSVLLFAAVIFIVAAIVSKLTGLPLFKKRKITPVGAQVVHPPLNIKMLLLGVVVGLLIMVPMIVVFVWLFLTIN